MISAIDMADDRSAQAVCRRARDGGLLTRPIRETIVFMPPLCISREQIDKCLDTLQESITDVLTENARLKTSSSMIA